MRTALSLCLDGSPATAGTPMPLIAPEFTRLDLASAFAAYGFTRGAEIGVERGQYSEALCQANPALQLVCVDAWQAYAGYREHVTQAKLDGFYRDTLLRLRPYGCDVRRGWSTNVAASVPPGSLDFVYIDGNHDFAQVVADLAAWEPKVRAGGIVAGHDYGRVAVGHVKAAVDAWTTVRGITSWYVLTGDRSPSWFWVVR